MVALAMLLKAVIISASSLARVYRWPLQTHQLLQGCSLAAEIALAARAT